MALLSNQLSNYVRIRIANSLIFYPDSYELILNRNNISYLKFTIPSEYETAQEFIQKGDQVTLARGFKEKFKNDTINDTGIIRWTGKVTNVSDRYPIEVECADLMYDLLLTKASKTNYTDTTISNLISNELNQLSIQNDLSELTDTTLYNIITSYNLKFIIEGLLKNKNLDYRVETTITERNLINVRHAGPILRVINPMYTTGIEQDIDINTIFDVNFSRPNTNTDIRVKLYSKFTDASDKDFLIEYPKNTTTDTNLNPEYRELYKVDMKYNEALQVAKNYYETINNIQNEGNITLLCDPAIRQSSYIKVDDNIFFVDSVREVYEPPRIYQELELSTPNF